MPELARGRSQHRSEKDCSDDTLGQSNNQNFILAPPRTAVLSSIDTPGSS